MAAKLIIIYFGALSAAGMKQIISYLHDYIISVNKGVLLFSSLFTALAIFINYHFDLNGAIVGLEKGVEFVAWYAVFLAAFGGGYLLYAFYKKERWFRNKKFLFLLLLAPAIFAWKMAMPVNFHFSTDLQVNQYWDHIVYWPSKLTVVTLMLLAIYRATNENDGFYGLTFRNLNIRPYLIMLLIMVPLIALASTQADFLRTYPKFQQLGFLNQANTGWYKLLFELSYGSDFFTIELFFRGFLVLAFTHWAGRDSILPMAMFYCTIHFGKPVAECISSYFGGVILGVVILNTRSIFGGLLVHVGIAWLMELGGYLGQKMF